MTSISSDSDSVTNRPVERLRLVGYFEGISYLLLLGVAMPLKYAADLPEAVLVVGWAHGLLFLLFWVAAGCAYLFGGLSLRLTGYALVASLLPAGPFVLDPYLRRFESRHPRF